MLPLKMGDKKSVRTRFFVLTLFLLVNAFDVEVVGF